MNTTQRFLTVRDIAARWRVSPSIVYQLVAGGRLPAIRIGTGRGTIRILGADVDAYERDHRHADAGEILEHLG